MNYIVSLFFISALLSQNNSISGFVRDAESRESLIGASVFLENTKTGSTTNIDGYYVIPNIANGEYTLRVEYIGYKAFTKKLQLLSTELKLDILLQEDVISSDLVEVIADEEKEPIEVLFDKPVSKVIVTNQQLSQIPQIGESDLLRSLQTLPGVLPISDFSSALYIRGGTPDQNLYLIDGADVYNPEHLFGLFSTFNTDAIKNAELLKGGFSANYGGRLSSVLDVINYEGNRDQFEGKASVSILAAKTTIQFPIGDRASISASLRRTYFDVLLGNSIPELPNYYFYDGNIKGFFELNDKNNLSISVFGGKDNLDLDFNTDTESKNGIHYDWGNITSSLKWTHIFTPSLFSNFWITTSNYKSDFNLLNGFVTEVNTIKDLTLKGSLEYQATQDFFLKMGIEQKFIEGSYKQSAPNNLVDIPQSPRQFSTYLSVEWKATDGLLLESGLRHINFSNERRFNSIEPRFSAKYRLDESKNLKFSSGLFSQFLHRIPRTFVTDIWTASDKNQGKSTSIHYIFGYQQSLSDGEYDIEGEVYYKNYDTIYRFDRFTYNLIPTSFAPNGTAYFTSTKGLFDEGKGDSRGLEITLRKNKGNITGWLAYSLASSKYQFKGLNQFKAYSPRHDRSHTINAVLNWNYTRWQRGLTNPKQKLDEDEWIFGINYVYSSGQPLTVTGSLYHVNNLPNRYDQSDGEYYLNPSTINSYRLPAYTRMDVSIKRKMKYRNWSMTPYLQIFNIGSRKNVWFLEFETVGSTPKRFESNIQSMFPLLPTFGVNFEF